jgi:ferric-chelate reductase [NAD(P)H]
MNPKALYKISYGLYVVTSVKDGEYNGQIANTVFQVASKPILIAASLNKENLTHDYVKNSEVFAVSVLAKDTPMEFIGRFGFKSGKDFNKFEGINYKIGKTGAPIILDDTVAYVEAKVVNSVDVATHTLFIGEVVDAELLEDKEVMTYEYYHLIKGGKAPKTATVYLEDSL